ncbi:MAG: hypothetical protein V3S12_00305 [Acidiferrobacterales bacterium]
MTGKQISAWVGGVIGVFTVIGMTLWGVPHYLKSQVHDLYKAEALEAGPAAVPEAVVENTAVLNALGAQLASMEIRMIERDKIQAERDAVIMQYFANRASN